MIQKDLILNKMTTVLGYSGYFLRRMILFFILIKQNMIIKDLYNRHIIKIHKFNESQSLLQKKNSWNEQINE